MKFGLVHRIMTDALASLGLLSLLTGGELDLTMSIVTGVCMVFAILIPERYQEHPRLRSLGVHAFRRFSDGTTGCGLRRPG